MGKKIGASSTANAVEEQKLERIAIFYKNFARVIHAAQHLNVKTYKSWGRGNIVRGETEIDELIELNAPVEVYYRYVD